RPVTARYLPASRITRACIVSAAHRYSLHRGRNHGGRAAVSGPRFGLVEDRGEQAARGIFPTVPGGNSFPARSFRWCCSVHDRPDDVRGGILIGVPPLQAVEEHTILETKLATEVRRSKRGGDEIDLVFPQVSQIGTVGRSDEGKP